MRVPNNEIRGGRGGPARSRGRRGMNSYRGPLSDGIMSNEAASNSSSSDTAGGRGRGRGRGRGQGRGRGRGYDRGNSRGNVDLEGDGPEITKTV